MRAKHIADIRRTGIYVHPSLPVFLLYAALTGHLPIALISVLSVFLHEMAHAAAAVLLGQALQSVELTPMGAILRMKEDRDLSWPKRIVILLAGPAMTLLLCFAAIRMNRLFSTPNEFFWLIFTGNMAIFMMNLLPVYPLDGGRVLSLMLGRFLRFHIVCMIMRLLGLLCGVALLTLNLISIWRIGGWNLSLSLAACCIISASYTETETYAMTEMRRFLDRKISAEQRMIIPASIAAVIHTTKLSYLVHKLPDRRIMFFVCLEAGSMKLLGMVSEYDAVQTYMKEPDASVYDALKMSQNYPGRSKYDTI